MYCLHHDTHIVDRPDEPSNDGSVHATSRLTINGFRHRGEAYDQTGPRASNLGSIRDIFYEDWDQSLDGMSGPTAAFASMIRGLYLDLPGYRGPDVMK